MTVSWPVVVTNRCADACAEAFGIGDRARARAWLVDVIPHGEITDRLPARVAGRRSPSGCFVVIADLLVLPLAADREGRAQWIATNCIRFPRATSGGPDAGVDLMRLTGWDLLSQVTVLPHAVERFQQRGGGHPASERAHQELLHRLAPTVRAARRPPGWCSTRRADLYLIAGDGDEFCLPCRPAGGARPFDVITCIHRAGDLFALDSRQLAGSCRLDPDAVAPDSRAALLITDAFGRGGRLSWHRPRWARPNSKARWWIVFHNRLAAAVQWHPDAADAPLVVVGLADGRPLLVRLLSRLRHRHRHRHRQA